MEKSEERKSGSSYIANKKSALRTVGEFLREARQSRNLSVEDLSSSLRIGKEQLIAIESGDEGALPEKVFIRAMVRRIAEKLNLDTSFILEELNEKKNNEPKSNHVIYKKNNKKIKHFNPFIIIILSGILGLSSSIMLLKYIQKEQNYSINPKPNYIILLDKNKSS
ncbi:helix-turn-helix domain-containing protein [Prochlorococcus marinus]|uniref:helix-turn-helix domain-containing protein n=1 Tax=Prochlorococcus marinus TaxID=1219 RepID=UPI0022B3F618|nr:helix-turn-helix domain-containing protein [Prochlorococcus marinus]